MVKSQLVESLTMRHARDPDQPDTNRDGSCVTPHYCVRTHSYGTRTQESNCLAPAIRVHARCWRSQRVSCGALPVSSILHIRDIFSSCNHSRESQSRIQIYPTRRGEGEWVHGCTGNAAVALPTLIPIAYIHIFERFRIRRHRGPTPTQNSLRQLRRTA